MPQRFVWKSLYEHFVWKFLYEHFVWKSLYEHFVWRSLYEHFVGNPFMLKFQTSVNCAKTIENRQISTNRALLSIETIVGQAYWGSKSATANRLFHQYYWGAVWCGARFQISCARVRARMPACARRRGKLKYSQISGGTQSNSSQYVPSLHWMVQCQPRRCVQSIATRRVRTNGKSFVHLNVKQNPCLQCNSLNDSRRPINP